MSSRDVLCVAGAATLLTVVLLRGSEVLEAVGKATEPIRDPIGQWIGQRFFELGQLTQGITNGVNEQVHGVPAPLLAGLGVTALWAVAAEGRRAYKSVFGHTEPVDEAPALTAYADPSVRQLNDLAELVIKQVDQFTEIVDADQPAAAPATATAAAANE
jgi:hypothetical protein